MDNTVFWSETDQGSYSNMYIIRIFATFNMYFDSETRNDLLELLKGAYHESERTDYNIEQCRKVQVIDRSFLANCVVES